MPTFTISVEWPDYSSHRGHEITPQRLKEIIEGYGCSVECETASVDVTSVVEVPNP